MPALATSDHQSDAGSADGPSSPRLVQLQHQIEHAAHLLPSQGPLTAFVHHNTLHAFEELSFEDAVAHCAKVYTAQPYWPEDRYRQMLATDRLRVRDLEVVLRADLGDRADDDICSLGSRFDLRLAMLQHSLQFAPGAELRWLIAETNALRQFRGDVSPQMRDRVISETRHWVMRDLRNGSVDGDSNERDTRKQQIRKSLANLFDHFGQSNIEHWDDTTWESFCLRTLWRICHLGVHGVPHPTPAAASPVRHRTLLLAATGEDVDLLVNDVLIRYCASFLDQGFGAWPLPDRELGFYASFLRLYGQSAGPPDGWLKQLTGELDRLQQSGIGPLASIEESLSLLGVNDDEREAFLSATLLALRGWAGMIWQVELNPDRVADPIPEGTLIEFLAIRLILERLALTHTADKALEIRAPLDELRQTLRPSLPKVEPLDTDQRTFLVFQLAQVMGWRPAELSYLSKHEWAALWKEIEEFSSLERRRVLHLAFERRYYTQALDAFSTHCQPRPKKDTRPRLQLFCCIDDREESFRRHLEEIAPDVETFGAAGFFNVVMYYRGAAEANFTPLCPIVVKPRHWVVEGVPYPLEDEARRRTQTRRLVGTASHWFHQGSRSFTAGICTALLGSFASFPLLARVLFPRFTAQLRRRFGRIVEPPPVRQLVLERTQESPGSEDGHVGYSLDEMTAIVENLLRDVGLTSHMARLIIITGHGSSSVNNPQEAAYNCGACAGARGGPNARAFSQMANDSRVRARVAENGIEIPNDTFFLGAYHNTCDDSVVYFDLNGLPPSHRADFEAARRDIDAARLRNAHERCRRFISAPLQISPEAALRHVEARSEDLAQPRPEYNHATNAMTVIARRSRTRGLFLDRRALLTSYDPEQDDEEHSLLLRVMRPVVPVCAGISLEYYFSCVDTAAYGCNNKLPHNVTAMLGVMLGAASDLQPGLNEQMVEIHEPLRHLFIVETTPEVLLQIMERDSTIGRLCRNGWIHIATLDPHSSQMHIFRKGKFERYSPETTSLPRVGSSIEWYRGWRDHLGFATIDNLASPPASIEGQTPSYAGPLP